ncbi:MAG: mannose-1-phosphate guanylyltransferase [Myxococcales bacterium]|nr:mannose-1-phosphate guanylyltransferase [Myxococcales bacterium]
MNHAIIMAGGSGTRFWPLSRREKPKQLLPLWGDRTLVDLTFERLRGFAPPERIYVVTGEHLAGPISEVLPDLPAENLIVEPSARNTLPCIALAAEVVAQRDSEATLGVFAADHYVSGEVAFLRTCSLGDRSAQQGQIATIGVRPTRPETGYGYIKYKRQEGPVLPVEAFVEKPDRKTALTYLEDGRYLWNAGIFFLSIETLRRELAAQQPKMADQFNEIGAALSRGDKDEVGRIFAEVDSISLDYGIMEGADGVCVIPAEFEWNDVGHWAALDEVLSTDPSSNIVTGEVCAIDSESSVLINQSSTGKLLAVVGLKDVVVVDTEDATLVLPKDQAQRVREVVAWLKEKRGDLL